MELELEKVAAAAFLDELSKILQPAEHEKIASYFHGYALNQLSLEGVVDMIKEAGFFDRAKSFVGGGNQNGIPMHSLGSMLGQSNPFQGMGSSLAGSARAAGGALGNAASAVGGKLQGAAGAVGNFLRGGEQNGIPMHSLGGQLAESSPFTGMGGSMKANVPSAMKGAPSLQGGGAAPAAAPTRSVPPPLPAAARGAGAPAAAGSGALDRLAGRLGSEQPYMSRYNRSGQGPGPVAGSPLTRGQPAPSPAGGGGGMFGALMSGMQGAKSNPLASMHLGG